MKKVRAFVKLQIPAGKATPAPPVGPALGQHGARFLEAGEYHNDEKQGLEALRRRRPAVGILSHKDQDAGLSAAPG